MKRLGGWRSTSYKVDGGKSGRMAKGWLLHFYV